MLKYANTILILNLKMMNDRVIFLATAYNYGFWKTAEQIENMSDKKYFSTTLLKTENYSYSDVSMFWFNQYLNETSDDKRSR